MYAKFTTVLVFIVSMCACQSPALYQSNYHANANTNQDLVRVDHVSWDKSASTPLKNDSYIADQARVVFIRPATNLADQSSANIAVNGRYLVSLQANHFTESSVCSGDVTLSVLPTGEKSNDLKALPAHVSLKPRQTYYYLVDVNKTSQQPTLTSLSEQQAQPLLVGKALQTHQISRVVNDCTVQTPEPAPVVIATPVAETGQATEVPNLRLDILFDHDKSAIKPQYQSEIAKAAQFLAHYPGAEAIVEGHTDANGDSGYNQALSQRRAESVRNALINQYAIDATRIRAIGYGEIRPIADNTTAQGRQKNRRVMIVIPSPAK